MVPLKAVSHAANKDPVCDATIIWQQSRLPRHCQVAMQLDQCCTTAATSLGRPCATAACWLIARHCRRLPSCTAAGLPCTMCHATAAGHRLIQFFVLKKIITNLSPYFNDNIDHECVLPIFNDNLPPFCHENLWHNEIFRWQFILVLQPNLIWCKTFCDKKFWWQIWW